MNVHHLELFYFVAKHGGIAAWSGKLSNIAQRLLAELETEAQMQNAKRP